MNIYDICSQTFLKYIPIAEYLFYRTEQKLFLNLELLSNFIFYNIL